MKNLHVADVWMILGTFSFSHPSFFLLTIFNRYWKVELWKSLFTNLLNMSSGNDKEVLQNLRKSFQDYLCSNPQLLKNLKELLAKQRASLCGA